MMFEKGIKVEVMKMFEISSGSWFRAEIISGNGRHYIVKYDHYFANGYPAIERVETKVIRPLPPTISRLRIWYLGDFVEVFENISWKSAKVVRALDGGDYYVVRLIGSDQEVKVHISYIRMWQSWEGNKWVSVGKDTGKLNEVKLERSPKPKVRTTNRKLKNDKGAVGPYPISFRRSEKLSHILGPSFKTYKRQIVCRKVDACASRRIFGCMDAFSSNRTTVLPELSMNSGKPSENAVHLVEHANSDGIDSSSGSCSPRNNPTQNMEIRFDDVEAPESPRIVGADEIHQLELNAYRRTMAAFYKSGPLSWEREDLLTNLRSLLHVTNDEYAVELRHLKNHKKLSNFS